MRARTISEILLSLVAIADRDGLKVSGFSLLGAEFEALVSEIGTNALWNRDGTLTLYFFHRPIVVRGPE
jgi:hypothetical protein